MLTHAPPLLFLPLLSFFLIGLVSTNLSAQQLELNGYVKTESSVPLKDANVLLLKESDSTLVTFSRTNHQGFFSLLLARQHPYVLKISHVGYVTKNIRIAAENKGSTILLDTIRLKQIDVSLMEVVVKAAKAPLRMKGDTLEYDISQFKIPPGTKVEDLLRRLPGIQVDDNGEIKAQGRNVEVLVEGRKFFSGNTRMATQNLLAEMLSVVQVYDSETEFSRLTGLQDGKKARMLNLKLKDLYKKMTFGEFYGGIGTDKRYETKLNINRFTDKHQVAVLGFTNNINQQSVGYSEYENFYGSRLADIASLGPKTTDYLTFGLPNVLYTGNPSSSGDTRSHGIGANYNYQGKSTRLSSTYYHNRSSMRQLSLENTQLFLPSENYSIDSDILRRLVNGGHQVAVNLEHVITAKDKIVVNGGINLTQTEDASTKTETYIDQWGNLVSDGSLRQENEARNTYLYLTSFYNHRFNKAGRSLSVSATYKSNVGDNPLLGSSTIHFHHPADSVAVRIQRATTSQSNHQLTSGVLYGQTIKPNLTFQAYYNYGHTKVGTPFITEDLVDYPKINDSLSLRSDYTVDFNRAGTQLSYDKNKFSLVAGVTRQDFWLDGRNTRYVNQTKLSETDQHFGAWSPTMNLTYRFSKINLTASYNRVLDQPNFRQIQPFVLTNDPRNIYVGNPNLQGKLRNEYRLFISSFNQETMQQAYAGLQYDHYARDIVQAKWVDENLITTYQYTNVEGGGTAFLYTGYNRSLSKSKLNLDIQYSLTHTHMRTPINGTLTNTYHWMHSPTLRLSWNISKRVFFSPSLNWTRNVYTYSIEEEEAQRMSRLNLNAKLNIELPAKIYFSSHFTYIENRSITNNYHQGMPIWNISLNKSITKNNKASLRLAIYDILDRRKDIALYSFQNVVSIREATVLGQYGMLTFIYNIRGVSTNLRN